MNSSDRAEIQAQIRRALDKELVKRTRTILPTGALAFEVDTPVFEVQTASATALTGSEVPIQFSQVSLEDDDAYTYVQIGGELTVEDGAVYDVILMVHVGVLDTESDQSLEAHITLQVDEGLSVGFTDVDGMTGYFNA